MTIGQWETDSFVPPGDFRDDRKVPRWFRQLGARKGIDPRELLRYVAADEELLDWGRAGTESVVLIMRSKVGVFARKIMANRFSACPWAAAGDGAMAPPARKGRYQVEYLTNLPAAAQEYFPTVLAMHEPIGMSRRAGEGCGPPQPDELVVDLSFIEGPSISSLVAAAAPPAVAVARLYEETLRLLRDKLHCHRVSPPPPHGSASQHLSKVSGRLALTHRALPRLVGAHLLVAERIRYDGIGLRNWPWLARTLRARLHDRVSLLPPRLCLTMGDTNTENVKVTNPATFLAAVESGNLDFTYDDLGLMFLDPRGIGWGTTGADVVDDYLYDLKIWHNSLGNYDVLANGHYQVRLSHVGTHLDVRIDRGPNPFDLSYEGIGDYFSSVIGRTLGDVTRTDPGWFERFLFVMGTHFLAMLPFHVHRRADGTIPDTVPQQRRVVALYCEGLWWLNCFVAFALQGELDASEAALWDQVVDIRFGAGRPPSRQAPR
jgi:hypothetical protein